MRVTNALLVVGYALMFASLLVIPFSEGGLGMAYILLGLGAAMLLPAEWSRFRASESMGDMAESLYGRVFRLILIVMVCLIVVLNQS